MTKAKTEGGKKLNCVKGKNGVKRYWNQKADGSNGAVVRAADVNANRAKYNITRCTEAGVNTKKNKGTVKKPAKKDGAKKDKKDKKDKMSKMSKKELQEKVLKTLATYCNQTATKTKK